MISDYLSPAERLECMKCGAMLVASELDREDRKSGTVKSANWLTSGLSSVNNAMLLLATALGVPIGVGAHMLSRAVAGKRFEEEKAIRKEQMLRDATDELLSGSVR